MEKLQFKILLFFFMLCPASYVVGQSIVINELMQSNVDFIRDDLIEYPDSWVELYNKGSQSVSLAGYKLGTTSDPAKAYKLPSESLAPGAYKLVFCDKVGSGWHTDFRLESGNGCVVYLFSGNNIVDKVDTLKKQPAPNIGYGRFPNGSNTWGYELNPTPGYTNAGGICTIDHILGNPVFSQTGKVQTTNSPITLTLSMPEGSPSGTKIYYTTDGSEPTTTRGKLYSSPISIGSTTVVRAKPFCDGWLSPMSVTHSYIFFPREFTLPVISIATNWSNLVDDGIGIFTKNNDDIRTNHKDWRRPINLEFFEKEGKKSKINQICETRVSGGESREFPRKSLIVYAHKRFGEKRFDYEFFPDQKPGLKKFKSLSLRNAGNDFEFLYMRDALVQRNMGMHTDLDWQAWRPAVVYINGEYYCMLNIRERSEEDNIYTNYDGLEDIDLLENWDNLKEGDSTNLVAFKKFYEQPGHTMAEYEKWMDCREFMNLMMLHLFYNNLDFPGNNIVMWRPKAEGGRWRWIAKDVDYAMGLYGIPYNYQTLKWLYNPHYDSKYDWNANGERYTLLFRRLMEDATFKNEFIERYAIYAGDFLNANGMKKVWDPMYATIQKEQEYMWQSCKQSSSVWRSTAFKYERTYAQEKANAQAWINNRTDEFTRQLCEFYNLESPLPLTINTTDQTNQLSKLTFNDHQLSEARYDGKYFRNHAIRLKAEAAKGKVIIGWRVKQTNGSTVKSNETMETTLNITMPSCTNLVVEPILRVAGDTNNNGKIDQSEIEELIKAIMGQPSVTFDKKFYDLNYDEKITVEDLVELIQVYNGL